MPHFIKDDFVRLRRQPTSNSDVFLTLAFGDEVERLEQQGDFVKLRALTHFDGTATGWADNKPELALSETGMFKFSMVDVQQGDGMVIESPSGTIVLVDGGDNKLFARHVAARFLHRGISAATPLQVEAIIITHGDADHFDGLNEFVRSETETGIAERKRLFIHPKRIYHNGLVKAPGKRPDNSRRPDAEMFGRTIKRSGETFILDLHDDPRNVPDDMRNEPFDRWVKTIGHWEGRGPISIKRIAFGDDEDALFDFLHEDGVTIRLQGPFPERQRDPQDNTEKPALRFFRAPEKSPDMHLEGGDEGPISASHTINGHSIAMQVQFGLMRMCLTGDLNKPAMRLMRENIPESELEAEIVKAPHHGSADFDFAALKAMRPVVAIISSGDENPSKEHIHPRATLMAALGKVMRLDVGIILNTELAAFFTTRDYAHRREDLKKYFNDHAAESFSRAELEKLFTGRAVDSFPEPFFAFERTNFGIIHIRTDGERVLVFTHSGEKGVNEAYSFTLRLVGGEREIRFAKKVVVR